MNHRYLVVAALPRGCRIEEQIEASSRRKAIKAERQSLFDRGFEWREILRLSARRLRMRRLSS
jgi:hypothetical protein